MLSRLILSFSYWQSSISRIRSLCAVLGCQSMADVNFAHGAGTSSNTAHGAGTSSNFAHGGENVELEDDMEEDPTDVPEDILEAEVEDFLHRVHTFLKRNHVFHCVTTMSANHCICRLSVRGWKWMICRSQTRSMSHS